MSEVRSLLIKPSPVVVGRANVDRLTMNDAVEWVVHALKHRGQNAPIQIMGPNAQLISLAESNEKFAAALQAANLCVPDGISIVLASRLLGKPAPERVTGGDLMEQLCAAAARHGFSVFFLGGLPGAAATAAAQLQQRYPGLKVAATYCPLPGFEHNPEELDLISRMLRQTSPDLLCVAFGAPKQEIWMRTHCPDLPIGAVIAVGAALDTQAGLRHRAPRWTHLIGMEWLYRLAREPRRLWKRYLFGNTKFIAIVLRQWLSQLRHPSSPQPSNYQGEQLGDS